MAAHYDTAIVPTRPRKPRDKAKVEVGVQVVERWILARLRNRRFFSLAELNQAIGELLDDLNARRTKHLGASRRQLFEALDQPALKPLPGQPYQYAEWKQRRAGLDYHVEAAKHYYSGPHALAKQSSGSGSRTAPSRSSIRVSASPPTCAVPGIEPHPCGLGRKGRGARRRSQPCPPLTSPRALPVRASPRPRTRSCSTGRCPASGCVSIRQAGRSTSCRPASRGGAAASSSPDMERWSLRKRAAAPATCSGASARARTRQTISEGRRRPRPCASSPTSICGAATRTGSPRDARLSAST